MFKKLRNLSVLFTGTALLVPVLAAAHVVVTPSQVGIGKSQTFSISVPNEKDVDVTQMKLIIPVSLSDVTPTVKAGWQITTDKSGSGETAIVKSITWSGGSIPAGLRDDFTFEAQAPANVTDLNWKAYQTYADGSTVAWDQTPTGSDDANGDKGPYSVSHVVDDLTPTKQSSNNNTALAVGVVALVFSVMALSRSRVAAKPAKPQSAKSRR